MNIKFLIDPAGNGCLGDFGFSVELLKVIEGRTLFTAKCFALSEGYYPSELSSGKYSPKSDVYSYEVICSPSLSCYVVCPIMMMVIWNIFKWCVVGIVLETCSGLKASDTSRADNKLVGLLELVAFISSNYLVH